MFAQQGARPATAPLFGWLGLALLLAVAIGAQTPPAPQPTPQPLPATPEPAQGEGPDNDAPQAAFGETVQVKVINVPVYVRDKKTDLPVTGLTVDDFELYEDGRLVPITNFYEVTEGRKVGLPPPPSAPNTGDVVESHPDFDRRGIDDVPSDERLHLVIYVDHFNIKPFNRNRVFTFLREFLRTKVDRRDRVMLVTYNRTLKIERGFTSDPAVISRALYELEKHTGGRVQYDSESSDLLRDIEEAQDPMQVQGRVRMHAESIFNDLQFTLDALKELASSIAGVPGRKAMLYVSDGLPMRAGEEMFHAMDEKMRGDFADSGMSTNLLDSLEFDASRRFTDLTRTANENGLIFYTLDAAGLRVSGMRSAEHGFTQYSVNVDSIATHNLQSSLLFMADETGGQSIINTNNFDQGLDRISQDFEHYYSLGYSPGHSGSGRFYRTEVKVKRKGWEIRYRSGYRDKSVETEMTETTLAALKFGFQDNQMGVEVHPAEYARRDDGTFMVHVDVRIPIAQVVLLPRPDDTWEARLRVWVQAADSKGRISGVTQTPFGFTIPSAELELARGKFWVYQIPLIMREGDQRVSFAVRDDVGARTSVLNRTIRVGS